MASMAAKGPGLTPMAKPSDNRLEAIGFAVALVLHAGLIYLMTRETDDPVELPPAMEVSFVDEEALLSSAPTSEAEPAPSFGEEMGAPKEASGADASVPAEVVPEEVPPPPTTDLSERRRPDITRNAVPIRTPTPRPTPRVAQNQPRPAVRPPARPARPAATPGRGQGQRSTGFDPRRLAESLGRGPPSSTGTARNPPAQLSGAQRQALNRQIGSLIQPCSIRAISPNGFARSISVELRVTVTAGGVPTGHQLVTSSGTNANNSDYVDDVVAVAMRAVRACSSRIATLPADQYAAAGGWRQFRYRFRFP